MSEGIGASEGTATAEGFADTNSANYAGYDAGIEYDESLDWSDTDIESDDYDDYYSEEEESSEEEQTENEYALKFLEGVELEAEDIEQIDYYTGLAKEIGLDPQQFNCVAGMVVMMQNEDAIQRMQESMQEEQLQLRNLKKDLSTQEKQIWSREAKTLTAKYGKETAQKICMDADIFRAFIDRSRQGTGIDIKKTQRASMSFESAVEARGKELQANLGKGDKKLAEIRAKWASEYPQWFKK